MATFSPHFRKTEDENEMPVWHYAEGVIGYTLVRDSMVRLDADSWAPRQMNFDERVDLHRWADRQGFPLTQPTITVLLQCGYAILSREEMDRLAMAEALWTVQRMPEYDAELAEIHRAIDAGELEFD